MRLSGNSGYLMLLPFDKLELPQFTVLVGPNGVGKSAFLQAIANGTFQLDHAQAHPAGITGGIPGVVHLHQGAPVPPFTAQIESRGTMPPNQPIHHPAGHLDGHRDIILSAHSESLAELVGISSSQLAANYPDFWRSGPDAIAEQRSWSKTSAEYRRLTEIFYTAEKAIIGEGPFPNANPAIDVRPTIRTLANHFDVSPLSITNEQYMDFAQWGTVDRFFPAVGQLLSNYRDARLRNDLACIQDKRQGGSTALSDEAFIKKFGSPPWEKLSTLLQSFGLAYRVVEPGREAPSAPYVFRLARLDSGVEIGFEALSSGEKVLLRFALSLFEFDPIRVQPIEPKLLLLDEVDASLHPQMLDRWLSAIRTELVERRGIECILTTHSPITVALAPDDSLYELVEDGAGPKKITKQEALNRLLVGVPALAIDYSGRRQVFVESDADAAIYEKLASALKATISLPRSLTFIAAGKNGAGDGGCASVIRLVGELTQDGNTTVLGLVDWDGKREPKERVLVLGAGTHYAIENVLLNPLMVAAYLIKRDIKVEGLNVPFVQLPDLDLAGCQRLADLIQDRIQYNTGSIETTPVPLICGFTLNIRKEYNLMQGHELERRLVAAFPALPSSDAAGAGKTVLDVVSKIVPELPNFCPEIIRTTLLELATLPL